MRKNSLFLIIFVLCFSAVVSAQTPTQTPPIETDEVVKITTTLIQVDATVTDKKGNVVRDLKPGEIEIYENGKKQNITNFSFVGVNSQSQSGQTGATPPPTGQKEKSPIVLPPAKLKPEQIRRTYALVVDDLGLSFASADYVKNTVKKFVNEQMQDGDLVAIVRVGGGLGALQSFTSDKRQLLAAADKIRWNGMSRTGVFSYEPLAREFREDIGLQKDRGQGIDPERLLANENQKTFLSGVQSDRQSNIALGSLGALNYVIRGMSELPGRKSIMFFSEGFELLDYSKVTPGQNFPPTTTRTLDALRSLIAAANRASIVFYTFDPRGIVAPGGEATDDMGITGETTFSELTIRNMKIKDSKDSLKLLAEETGGLAYVDLNKMESGVEKAVETENGYYLIGYEPDEESFDPAKAKFNKLEVKVTRPDLKVRYRSGFLGITDDDLKEKVKQNLSPVQKINAALTSPFGAKEIELDLYSIFYSDEKNKDFIRSFIKINANDLKFDKTANGKYKATILLAAMTFGDNGAPVDQALKSYALELDEKGYQNVLQKGFVYDFLLPIKKPGAYQFRLALRDESTEKIGAVSQFIEVPNIGKKDLTLSSIILKNYSLADWKKVSAGQGSSDAQNSSVFSDTASRKFNRGTVLNYLYQIYNAKTDVSAASRLQIQTRLFCNGKMLLQSQPVPLNTKPNALNQVEVSDSITLGTDLQPGDYVLQLMISDTLADKKKQIASQAIEFEVTN